MQRAAFALVVGLLAAAPLLLRGPSCGHDFDFHLQSWFAVREAWRQGLLVPHWVAGANYGAGEPRFVFYPPLTWLLGAALGCVLPWALVPAAFTALCFAGAASSMHRVAARLVGSAAAPVAATFYALSPYLLFTGYERTAYGELLAAVWTPLLLEALLLQRWRQTALLIAALWYTNAPAAVMGCYLLLLALGWRMAGRSRLVESGFLQHIARALLQEGRQTSGALLLGGALAADYLIPAWYEQRFVAVGRAVGPGMRVEDSFLFGQTGEPFHDQVLRTASWIAVVTFSAGALAALAWARRSLRASRRGSAFHQDGPDRLLSFLALLLTVAFLLQLPFTRELWHVLPELAFLQFPWRLLLPASAAAALLVAAALSWVRGRGKAAVWALTLAYAVAAMVWVERTRYQPCDEEDNVAAQQALVTGGEGFEGTDEYTPVGADNGEVQRGLPHVRLLAAPDADEGDSGPGDTTKPPSLPQRGELVAGRIAGHIDVRLWSSEALRVRATPARDAYAVLRLERFPAWQVLLNGAPCGTACVPRDDGLVTVHLPPGRTSEIDARYRTTGDVELGRALSSAALLVIAVQAAAQGRWRTRRRSSSAAAAQL